ncbi:hypothetical protein DFH08DRAFT_513675 [Mycena albidolilacea]|uniref:Uncharacterized protein n=1 Tax=Mycena albidolilacea TaxID=1033008 RepID=A0AAD6Z3U8_9AGAR|nr:hypothetical protein DFH08DRAFT_513675 [Mycena albidolilacea]
MRDLSDPRKISFLLAEKLHPSLGDTINFPRPSQLPFLPGILMALPQELVDIILDIIRDDIASLKCCSLAARTFVTSARKHIFKKIEISHPLSSCEMFHKLLCSSPHIAPLVEDLCIVSVLETHPLFGSDMLSDPDRGRLRLELDMRRVSWVMSSGTLTLVLPLLNLKRISVIENATPQRSSEEYAVNWNKLDQHLQSALAGVFSSPRLEAVHLRGVVLESPCQLLSLFSEATALKEMSLSRLYFTQQEPWPESRIWRPTLRSLLLNDIHADSFSQYLLNPRIDLASIGTLALTTYSDQWENITMPTTNLRPGVDPEHLRLNLMCYRTDLSPDVFGTNLRCIHVFSYVLVEQLGIVLKACPRDSGLEHIILDGPADMHRIPKDPEFYAAIDATLDHLRALETIEFRSVIRNLYPTLAPWEAAVQAAFPSLVRRGVLRVTEIEWRMCTVDPDWE